MRRQLCPPDNENTFRRHTHVQLSPHFIFLDLQATEHELMAERLVFSLQLHFFHKIQKWLRRYDGKCSSSGRKKTPTKWKMTEVHSSRVWADTQTSYCVKLLHGSRLPPESSLHSVVAFTKPGLTAGMRKWPNGVSRPRCSRSAPVLHAKICREALGAAMIVAIE